MVWGWLWLAPAMAATEAALAPAGAPYHPGRILVQPKAGVRPEALAQLHATQHSRVLQTFEGLGHVQVVSLPEDETVPGAIAKYRQSGLVEFAEPDYGRHLDLTPNDPKYLDGTLWALNNYGQGGGTAHADIDAPSAWDVLASASNVVVAVLDSGVRYTHEDLAANMWVNPRDGSHGWNALTGTNDPNDDNGHGTWMAGVLGAVGNNGKGVVGVAWQVQIMACKCFDSAGNGNDSAILACLDYARTNGARIINASWGSTAYGQALSNALYAARQDGILVVTTSGDVSRNIDVTPYYPACYGLDNIVSVAYTTPNDTLGRYSGYGATNVDLAAPGVNIYAPTFTSDTAYFGSPYLQGTSYAAAYVSGALALMLNRFPGETHQQIIGRLLQATDPLPDLAGKCVSGGRLNLLYALSPPVRLLAAIADGSFQLHVSSAPNQTCVIQASTNLTDWTGIFTNATSAAGTFDFTDLTSASHPYRFYRAVAP
jgi:subtilisin family serine protease